MIILALPSMRDIHKMRPLRMCIEVVTERGDDCRGWEEAMLSVCGANASQTASARIERESFSWLSTTTTSRWVVPRGCACRADGGSSSREEPPARAGPAAAEA